MYSSGEGLSPEFSGPKNLGLKNVMGEHGLKIIFGETVKKIVIGKSLSLIRKIYRNPRKSYKFLVCSYIFLVFDIFSYIF